TIHKVIGNINKIACSGVTKYNLLSKINYFAGAKRDIIIFISDLLGNQSIASSLLKLKTKNTVPYVIQILSKEDLTPSLTGPFTLTDIETGERLNLNITKKTIASYTEKMGTFLNDIKTEFTRNLIKYALILNRDSHIEILKKMLMTNFLDWYKK
ncbi:MAG: hypothetical protein HY606_05380, partial [Planctomycetes bacterium]|nr:hypothetical protein [Planctomycetota bacterium]